MLPILRGMPDYQSERTALPDHGRSTLPRGVVAILKDEQAAREAIGELYQYTLSEGNTDRRGLIYPVVESGEASSIGERIGLDLGGYRHVIDSYAIRHANRKHGSPRTELPRGRLSLTAEDFMRVPEVVAPENIAGVTQSATGNAAIVYRKRFNGSVVVVEEIQDGRGNLAVETV